MEHCWLLAAGTSEEGMPGYSYEPSDLSGWIWNRGRSVGSLGRAYNYPHQVRMRPTLALTSSLCTLGSAYAHLLGLHPVHGEWGLAWGMQSQSEPQLRPRYLQQPDAGVRTGSVWCCGACTELPGSWASRTPPL